MKHIHIIFEDQEYEEKVKPVKKQSKQNWHDFLLELIKREREVRDDDQ